ncbi:MAG: hypothetical protein WCW02_03380 [Candidatus Buchananbacteria bacterium]
MNKFFKPVLQVFSREGFLMRASFYWSLLLLILALVSYAKSYFFNDHNLPPKNNVLTVILVIAIFLFVFSFVYFWKKIDNSQTTTKRLLWFSLVFCLIAVVSLPLLSTDFYTYLIQSKVLSNYSFSPYLITTDLFSADPVYHATVWDKTLSPYGPVQFLLYWLPSKLFGNCFWLNFLSFKILNLVFFWGCAFVIYLISTKFNSKFTNQVLYLWLWNPLVLLELLLNGHNDVFMIFFILLAGYFLLQDKILTSLIFLVCAFFTKLTSIIVAPFFLLFLVLNNKLDKLLKLLLGFLLTASLLVLFVLAPFGFNLSFLNGIRAVSGLCNIATSSFLQSLLAFGVSFKVGLGSVFICESQVVFLGYAVLAVVFLILGWLFKKDPKVFRLFELSALAFLGYLVLVAGWVQPWYFLWPIALCLLSEKLFYRKLVLTLTLLGFLNYFSVFKALNIMIAFYVMYYPEINRFSLRLFESLLVKPKVKEN